MPFAFTQFEHGAVCMDADLKCSETWVVFERDTTAQERAWIEAECPSPVRSFCWGERFAYFGSSGDTFEFEVTSAFGGTKVADLMAAEKWGEVMEHTEPAMVAFIAAYDAWLDKVHARVPIAFTCAATPTEPDDWAEWSAGRYDEALVALRTVREAHPWLAKPSVGSQPKPADHLAPRARAAECFGWIERGVSQRAADAPVDPKRVAARLDATIAQLAAIDITLPLERLSISEHNIHSHGAAFGKLLDALGKPARVKALAKLAPWPRLVYYASYTALDNGDLAAAGRDLAKALDALVDELPEAQHWHAAALLGFIAANLAHLTPAFDKPVKAKAKPALAVFRRAIARGACHAEVLYDAMRCAKLANDRKALAAVGDEAIDATRNPSVAKAAAKLARAMRDAAAAKRFDTRAKALAASSKLAQNETDVAKLAGHLAAGGEPTIDLVNNLAVRFDASSPPAAIGAHVDRLAELLLREPTYGTHPDVVLNFCVMCGNHGHAERAIEVVDQLLARGLPLGEQLGLSFSYAATVTKKTAAKKTVLARLADVDPGEASPLTFSNLGVVHLSLRDKPAALAALVQARELGHPKFAELRRHSDFAALHGDKEFEALFRRGTS